LILTVTINPSVDRNVQVDRLVFEDRAYILARSDSAGGRGMNASRVLHSFGAKTLAIVTSGGASGERLQKLAGKVGVPREGGPHSQREPRESELSPTSRGSRSG